MVKISLKYGLICGALLTSAFFVLGLYGFNPMDLFVNGFLIALFVFFSCKEFKSYHNAGFLHFWQGMSSGFLVVISASLLFMAVLGIYYAMDHEGLNAYLKEAENFLRSRSEFYENELGKEAFESLMQEVSETTTAQLIFSLGIKKIVTGLLVTPVISIILRKQPN